jgi:phage replication-related protein YjqB (UPF0714/DUF867 family)
LFDEPQCLQLIKNSDTVVAIHGCGGEQKSVFVGGLAHKLKTRLVNAMVATGFDACLAGSNYAGNQSQNLCNRCSSGMGVQLEISAGLRRAMFKKFDRLGRKNTTDVFTRFTTVVHDVLIFAGGKR